MLGNNDGMGKDSNQCNEKAHPKIILVMLTTARTALEDEACVRNWGEGRNSRTNSVASTCTVDNSYLNLSDPMKIRKCVL